MKNQMFWALDDALRTQRAFSWLPGTTIPRGARREGLAVAGYRLGDPVKRGRQQWRIDTLAHTGRWAFVVRFNPFQRELVHIQ